MYAEKTTNSFMVDSAHFIYSFEVVQQSTNMCIHCRDSSKLMKQRSC